MKNENRIIVALDINDICKVKTIVKNIKYDVIYKIGMEFFYTLGMSGVDELKRIKPNIKIFLDLKLHDIPNTVSKAIEPLIMNIKPYMLTLHVSGGYNMLNAAVKVTNEVCKKKKLNKPILLGVTILTSLKKDDLIKIDWNKDIKQVVVKLSILAKKARLDGVVCSAKEIKSVRENFYNCKIVTPGIRFKKDNKQDQERVMSPREAINAGADYIVIGRSLLNANNPNILIEKILNSF